MSKYKEKLEQELHNKKCPNCEGIDISIDNWGIFEGERDWFYFCKECDRTFK